MGFDAVMVLSFGGPEGPDDVMPFLHNVLQGRPVTPGRLEEIASHYMHFGGRSPINSITRDLVDALGRAQDRPLYWGNRNWHPFASDTVARMRDDGVRRAAVFATSAYSSFSGCRQYIQDLASARAAVGPGAPELVKLRPFSDHPGFLRPLAEGLRKASGGRDAAATRVLMSAHSIPSAQAAYCGYEAELQAAACRVADLAGVDTTLWQLVFQSRSGPPSQPWLEPDIAIAIAGLPDRTESVIVVPIGFVADHMEVIYDLDVVARRAAEQRGVSFARTPTPGTHPDFVAMICDLIEEAEKDPKTCPDSCCPTPGRPSHDSSA